MPKESIEVQGRQVAENFITQANELADLATQHPDSMEIALDEHFGDNMRLFRNTTDFVSMDSKEVAIDSAKASVLAFPLSSVATFSAVTQSPESLVSFSTLMDNLREVAQDVPQHSESASVFTLSILAGVVTSLLFGITFAERKQKQRESAFLIGLKEKLHLLSTSFSLKERVTDLIGRVDEVHADKEHNKKTGRVSNSILPAAVCATTTIAGMGSLKFYGAQLGPVLATTVGVVGFVISFAVILFNSPGLDLSKPNKFNYFPRFRRSLFKVISDTLMVPLSRLSRVSKNDKLSYL